MCVSLYCSLKLTTRVCLVPGIAGSRQQVGRNKSDSTNMHTLRRRNITITNTLLIISFTQISAISE